jgi:hypothetical protein
LLPNNQSSFQFSLCIASLITCKSVFVKVC